MENQTNPKKQLDSGAFIPYIGYGTYQLRGKECQQGVKWALQTGYTHIDTASIYRNEEVIGKVLKDMKIDRNSIFITSKIASTEQGYDQAIESCNNMLKRLNCGYLDLLIIHWPGVSNFDSKSQKNRQIRRETWRALIQLKKQGKVRDIGVSNFLKHHLEDLLQYSQVKPAINQFELHPLLWQEETINFCRQHKIAIEAYSPLARSDERLLKNKTMLNLEKKYKKSVAQICLKWALQHDFIVLPKSKSKDRIIQNFILFDFKISNEDMAQIDKLRSLNVHTCWNPNSIIY